MVLQHPCDKDHYKWVIFATLLDVWHLNGDIKIGSIGNEFI